MPGAVFSPIAHRLRVPGGVCPLHVGDTWLEPFAGARMEDLREADHPGLHRYCETRGVPALIDAIVEKVRARNRIACERESVVVTAGDITLNAVAAVGTLVTPDTLPVANVTASVSVNGATLTGDDITLNAAAALVSSVANLAPSPAAGLLANMSADVAVTGNSTITAAGAFTATATSNVNSTVLANAVPGAGVVENGTALPVITWAGVRRP